jgi:hypothetical protein
MEQEQQEKIEEAKMRSWRSSEHYEWVMKVIENELNSEYTKSLLIESYTNHLPVDSTELGDAMKIEYQATARIQNIKDALQ